MNFGIQATVSAASLLSAVTFGPAIGVEIQPAGDESITGPFALAVAPTTNALWRYGVEQLGAETSVKMLILKEDGQARILVRGTKEEVDALREGRLAQMILRGEIPIGVDPREIDPAFQVTQSITLRPNPNEYYPPLAGDDQPVTYVDWLEVAAFAAVNGFEIPSNAEWILAAGLMTLMNGKNDVDEWTRSRGDIAWGRSCPCGFCERGGETRIVRIKRTGKPASVVVHRSEGDIGFRLLRR